MSKTAKWLRVVVTDLKTGESKSNVRIPGSLASFGLKMAAKYAPDSIEGLDLDELFAAAESGGDGKLVDVDDLEKGQHVEVYIETGEAS